MVFLPDVNSDGTSRNVPPLLSHGCPSAGRFDGYRMEKCVEEIRRRFGKDSIRNGVLCQNLRLPPEKAEITMPTGMVG